MLPSHPAHTFCLLSMKVGESIYAGVQMRSPLAFLTRRLYILIILTIKPVNDAGYFTANVQLGPLFCWKVGFDYATLLPLKLPVDGVRIVHGRLYCGAVTVRCKTVLQKLYRFHVLEFLYRKNLKNAANEH